MDPVSGNALTAEENGCSGFTIHGGDPEANTDATWYNYAQHTVASGYLAITKMP